MQGFPKPPVAVANPPQWRKVFLFFTVCCFFYSTINQIKACKIKELGSPFWKKVIELIENVSMLFELTTTTTTTLFFSFSDENSCFFLYSTDVGIQMVLVWHKLVKYLSSCVRARFLPLYSMVESRWCSTSYYNVSDQCCQTDTIVAFKNTASITAFSRDLLLRIILRKK